MVVLQWAPTLVVALVVCLMPGLLVTFAMGMRGSLALGLAPHFSILVVVASGGLARVIGAPLSAPFGLLVLGAVLMLSVLVALAVRGVIARPGKAGDMRWVIGSVGLGTLALGVALLRATGTPEGWPQMPDNIFHVGAVTWMVRHETWWMGDVGGYTGGAGGFTAYPGAWHSLAAGISAWSGASALSASHALVLVIGGVVWPLGCVLLSHVVINDSRLTTVTAVAASLLFFMMPTQSAAWGVLWPYLLGLALVPGCLAALLHAATLPSGTPHPWSWAGHIVVVGATVAVTVTSHPSMAFVIFLLGAPLVINTIAVGRRHKLLLPTVVVAAALLVGAWSIRPETMISVGNSRPQDTSAPIALLVLTAMSPNSVMALVLTAVLVVAALVASREPRNIWVGVGVFAPLMLSVVVYLLPTTVATALAWPWWNAPERIRAVAAPCSVVAIVALASQLSAKWSASSVAPTRARISVGIVATVIAGLAVHANGRQLSATYAPTDPDVWWATAADRRNLQVISEAIPVGSAVAADPYSGGTHLFLTRDITLLFPTERAVDAGGDKALIGRGLSSALRDPNVCRALRDADVRVVVTGTRRSSWGLGREAEYSGFRDVSAANGFVPLLRRGQYVLWQVPECEK